ncbi:hypothetical protein MOV08_43240 [Streptomyces yunnanensis]|uniref:Phage integrase family protein n=1 Tax=Streptomyces yunnanensis TaxID=156453 RepID=A0ABY8ANJ3_9ACTN|nr:hypothetical protein [Streptomyces yunnanensis]WEB45435.1 hypothetical protein MOV08_43240 [Streptomyces yunnanensis]
MDYYNTGKCRRCHLYGTPAVESCPHCLAWGTTRKWKWLCQACHSWRQANPTQAPCPTCGTIAHLHQEIGICRLCFAHARNMIHVLGRFDPVEANRQGQQLFFAGLTWQKGSSRTARRAEQRARNGPSQVPTNMTKQQKTLFEQPLPLTDRDYITASRYEQTTLFAAQRDHTKLRQRDFPWPTDTALLLRLWKLADQRSARLGWSAPVRMRCRAGLRIALGLQDTPGAPIPLTSLDFLTEINLTSKHVAAVLDEAGLLIDDRERALDRWIEERLAGLPEQMTSEVRIWYQVMVTGRSKPPRRRPRNAGTIRLHFSWALPVLAAWAADGHTTLRTITREHVATALADSDHPSRTGQGLRSMFQLLKQDHVLFADPTYRMRLGYHPTREPLPVKTAAINALLDPSNPARAAVAAIVAFHGLHTGQVRDLKLVDISAGWLHIDGRKIPLAVPVRERVAAYLNYRNTTWPNTANPHLFINRRSAMELRSVGKRWIKLLLGPDVSCRSIREDRILAEALATRGDARRLQDMFGLSINASLRYTNVVDHPGFVDEG